MAVDEDGNPVVVAKAPLPAAAAGAALCKKLEADERLAEASRPDAAMSDDAHTAMTEAHGLLTSRELEILKACQMTAPTLP